MTPDEPPSREVSAARPLLITADGRLLDDLLRLGALAGTELQVAPDPAAARPLWRDAPLVLVGA
ncbi:MAG: hypothetical protein ACRDT4_27635, partial [Micromonosporaceae bacterium]